MHAARDPGRVHTTQERTRWRAAQRHSSGRGFAACTQPSERVGRGFPIGGGLADKRIFGDLRRCGSRRGAIVFTFAVAFSGLIEWRIVAASERG